MKRKQQVNFEWSIGDDDWGTALVLPNRWGSAEPPLTLPAAPWRRGDRPAAGQAWGALPLEPGQWISAGEVQFLRNRLRDLFLLALAVILLGSMPFTPDQVAQQRAEEGVTAALATEYSAWQRKDRDTFTALIDLPMAERWQWEWRDYWSLPPADFADLGLTVRRIDRQGELVRVEALVTRPSTKWWRSSPYREIRFYRETEKGWLRTMPADSHWGEAQAIETTHLRFEYRAHDAPVVEAQVDRLEALYLQLYQWVELNPETKYKWTFVLLPDRTDGRTGYYYRNEFTSPVLAEVPDMLTDEEYVAQMIVSSMTSQAVYGASPTRRNYLHRWEMIVWSLYGWLRSDLLGQRSPWHAQAQEVFKAALPTHFPLSLDDIEHWADESRPAQERVMRQYMVSESIVDFAMNHYGRDKLPELLTAMEVERSWDELTMTVFDVSAPEFEVTWNRYIKAKYLDE
ncbi:MAG: hypothetical protein DYG89_44065 [Caldilinea sp. CFX5]|nr:hypothetical protein [Caldilinea sp. CFX5]